MNLIQMTKTVKDKEKLRNKLLGQKEMLMEGLKDLGFKNLGEAKKSRTAKKNELTKMNTHYCKGEEKFKTDFGHLLQ
ncbi:MAG: hypothetical protein GY797_28310 [Deltaproteobacteria bacterium]|nr:hypothetical protein [Deltaproteobacteria bacterium]